MILQTLYQQCVKRDVRFFNEFYCLDLLLTDEGHTAGVVAYELATGELHVFRAKSVLFATGGYGRMFRVSSNAHALTGDGLVGRVPTRDPARRTWSSSSSTRPASTGSACCSPRGRAARARSCGTVTASGSWSATPRRSRTSPRGTSSPARSTRRSGRDEVSVRRATTSTSTSRTWIRRSSRRSCRISRSSPACTSRSSRRGSRCRSNPRRITRWVASRRTCTAGSSRARTRRPCRVSTRRASAPASRSTARTGSGPTPCSTSSSSGDVAATIWRGTAPRPTSPISRPRPPSGRSACSTGS